MTLSYQFILKALKIPIPYQVWLAKLKSILSSEQKRYTSVLMIFFALRVCLVSIPIRSSLYWTFLQNIKGVLSDFIKQNLIGHLLFYTHLCIILKCLIVCKICNWYEMNMIWLKEIQITQVNYFLITNCTSKIQKNDEKLLVENLTTLLSQLINKLI